jgi:hypothetical protein
MKGPKGDALSCILFNIASEKVVRDSGIQTKGITYNKATQILGYAEDIVLMRRVTGVLKEAIIDQNKAGQEIRLKINLHELNICKKQRDLLFQVDDREFERAREFKYIGSILTEDNNITTEIKQNCDGKSS